MNNTTEYSVIILTTMYCAFILFFIVHLFFIYLLIYIVFKMNNYNHLIDFIDEVNYIGERRPQVFHDRPNYYDILTEDEFIYRFRFLKNV